MKKIYFIMVCLISGLYLSLNGQSDQVADSAKLPEVLLPDLVVSASKMNIRQKELTVPVTIIPAKTIQNNQISNLNQLGTLVPNFTMGDYGSKLTSPVYIRGIGSRINAPAVGLYVDNVPYFDKSTFSFDFFDVDHIEILRGPQGVLFGRNTMGGLINLTTLSPMNYQGARLEVNLATYGNYKVSTGYYAKPTDRFAYSIAASCQHADGFFENKYLGKKVDWLDSYGFRNRLIYKLSNAWSLENIASLEQSRQGGYPYGLYNKANQTLAEVNYNQESSYTRFMLSDALLLKYGKRNWEFNSAFTYQYFKDAQKIDQDFSSDSLYFAKQFQKQNMFSYEGRFHSKGDRKFSWLAGVFAFYQHFDNEVQVDAYKSGMWYSKLYDTNNLGFACFGQGSLRINSHLSLSGGIRYDHEVNTMGYTYHGNKGSVQLTPVDTLYPQLRDHMLLPRFTLTYKVKNGTLYSSYTTGYKPGGFNTSFETPEELNFRFESSDNYEVGMKTDFFHELLFTDISVFYTSLNHQQIYRTTPSGVGSYLDNSGRSENMGFEFSAQTALFYGFEFNVSYGYTHAEIIRYEQSSTINYNHQLTPYIPRYTLAIQLNKTISLHDHKLLDGVCFNLLFHQKGVTYWDLNNNYPESAYQLLDGKVVFTRKKVRVDLWCKNIFNTSYKAFLFEALGNAYAQAGKPRQLGISLSLQIK